MFIAYYLIPTGLELFFALGLSTQYIINDMLFSFQLFVAILSVFYLFLFLLLLSDYIPFSNRPETMFVEAHERFVSLLVRITEKMLCKKDMDTKRYGFVESNHAVLLRKNAGKMKLWESKLDYRYFDTLNKNAMQEYLSDCEKISVLIAMLQRTGYDLIKNKNLSRHSKCEIISDINKGKSFAELFLENNVMQKAQNDTILDSGNMEKYLEEMPKKEYWQYADKETVTSIAVYAALRNIIWKLTLRVCSLHRESRMEQLNWSRF